MLKDSLYTILLSDHRGGIITATLELDKEHAIFNGHFPGRPVLPGACMLQMVKEVLETELGRSFMLTKAVQMKFLELIDPRVNNVVELMINYTNTTDHIINASATLSTMTATCFKFRGDLI